MEIIIRVDSRSFPLNMEYPQMHSKYGISGIFLLKWQIEAKKMKNSRRILTKNGVQISENVPEERSML